MSKENLYSSEHKATNDAYRERYDQIEWDTGEDQDESDES